MTHVQHGSAGTQLTMSTMFFWLLSWVITTSKHKTLPFPVFICFAVRGLFRYRAGTEVQFLMAVTEVQFLMAVTAWQQRCKATSYTVSRTKKQRVKNPCSQLTFSFSFSQGPSI